MDLFGIQPVILVTDALLLLLLVIVVSYAWYARRHEHLASPWKRLGKDSIAMGCLAFLLAYAMVGLADSVHFRLLLPNAENSEENQSSSSKVYSAEVISLLDLALTRLRNQDEKTYSAPFATHLFSKESIEQADGSMIRDYPRLEFGGAHLIDGQSKSNDILKRSAIGLLFGLSGSLILLCLIGVRQSRKYSSNWRMSICSILKRQTHSQWRAFWICSSILICISCILVQLCQVYHVFGTDKIGQDVLYQALKSVRTGLLIGTLTTLIMLPFAILMGIAAGYFRGWMDDIIQYIYTTLNSIPSVLLIASAVLMLQVYLNNNAEDYSSVLERADMRLLFLCIILGITSWTSLCRYLRAETLKLREMDYIAAARSQGVGHTTIITRHILPNVMHIVLITVALDFSSLVLAEAVLAYVQIGVDPTTESWGNMINSARLEMAREPIVWWSLSAAFVFMFALVLAANLFADAIRNALDPREQHND